MAGGRALAGNPERTRDGLIFKRCHGEVFLAAAALGDLARKVVVHLVNLAAMLTPGLYFHAKNPRKIIDNIQTGSGRAAFKIKPF